MYKNYLNQHIKSHMQTVPAHMPQDLFLFYFHLYSLEDNHLRKLALYIYPRLCKFRDEYAHYGTPGCLCHDENGKQLPGDEGHIKWMEILDKMILAFRYIIVEPSWKDTDELREIQAKIDEGMHLFADYYQCLWY